MEKRQNWAIVIRGVIFLLVCSGNFRSPAFQISMYTDGTYRWLCPAGFPVNEPCQPQLVQYSMIFVWAGLAYLVLGPMFGQMVDILGTRNMNFVTSLMMGMGVALFMISSEEFPMYTVSFCFLTCAGACVYFQGLLLPMYSPENTGMINAIVNNSWDASACMFMIFLKGSENGFKLNTMFLIYLILGPVCMCLSGYWLLPSYKTEKRLIRQIKIETTALDQVKTSRSSSSLSSMSISFFAPPATKGILDFLTDPQFISLATAFALLALRATFFMNSYMLRLKNIEGVDSEMIYRATYFNSIVFPITAVTLTPIVGYLLDVYGLPMTHWVLNILSVFHIVSSMFNSEWTLYVATFTLAAVRTILYSALSVGCGENWGFDNVGLTVGISLEMQALMCLVQFPLLSWVTNDLSGNFFYADMLTGLCVMPITLYTMYITYKQGGLFKKTEDQYEEIKESGCSKADILHSVQEKRILLIDPAAEIPH